MRSKYYFIRLINANKLLFSIILVFCLLNLSANFIFKAEHTPLFRWDLYSQKIPPQKIYSFLEVRYNDDNLLAFPYTWQEPQKLLFINTLNHFIAMKRNNDNDPLKNYIDYWNQHHPFFQKIFPGLKFYNDTTELNQFPTWYKNYLEQHLHKTIYRISVYEIKVAYLDNGEIKKLSSNLIYNLL